MTNTSECYKEMMMIEHKISVDVEQLIVLWCNL